MHNSPDAESGRRQRFRDLSEQVLKSLEQRATCPTSAHAVTPSETRVSVIMAVFQGERYIRGAIQSVLDQTHQALEIWVVDDGSTDGTMSILESVSDPRVHILKQANAGAAAARNLGLSHATGTYIAFLDHDDRWLPNKLATEIAILRSAPDPIGIAYSWYYAVDEEDRLLHAYQSVKFSGNVFDALLENDNFLIPSVTLLHRNVVDNVGGFDNIFHEDHAFALKACRLFPAYPTCRRLVSYRQTQRGKCRGILSNYEVAYREQIEVVNRLRAVLTDEEATRFAETQKRTLLFRFLMYGFTSNAKRLLAEVDIPRQWWSAKGLLARIYAITGANPFPFVRFAVERGTSIFLQAWWSRQMKDPAGGGK
jgi:glycosyltransferase involved in cell wall biosynthesis